MRGTRVLSSSELNRDVFLAAVNVRCTDDDGALIVSGNSQAELVRIPVATAPLAVGLVWTFLQGRAFAHTQADETYACLNVPGPNGVNPFSLFPDQLTEMYEEIVSALPDFNGDAPGSWYLAVEFQMIVQYVYVEYLPNDPSCNKWSLSVIHGQPLACSW